MTLRVHPESLGSLGGRTNQQGYILSIMSNYYEQISNLRAEVFTEPATVRLRPQLISFIELLTDRARSLSEEELFSSKGADLSSLMCGALAWQGARGVEGDDWITEQDEPELYELLQITGSLDVDNNQPDKWVRLFNVVSGLK